MTTASTSRKRPVPLEWQQEYVPRHQDLAFLRESSAQKYREFLEKHSGDEVRAKQELDAWLQDRDVRAAMLREAMEAERLEDIARTGLYGEKECDLCNKCFDTPSEMKAHLRSHRRANKRGGRIYHCDHCNFMSLHKSNVARHQRERHRAAPETLRCGECSRAFATRAELDAHRAHEHTRRWYCAKWPCCENAQRCTYFRDRWSLERHLALKHRQFRENGVYLRDSVLYKSRAGKLEKPHACDQCAFAARTAELLAAHVSSKHEEKQVCWTCLESVEPGGLQQHNKEHHADKLTCTLCDPPRIFARSDSLRTHVETGAHKIRVCRTCDPPKEFAFQSELKRHIKRVHCGSVPN